MRAEVRLAARPHHHLGVERHHHRAAGRVLRRLDQVDQPPHRAVHVDDVDGTAEHARAQWEASRDTSRRQPSAHRAASLRRIDDQRDRGHVAMPVLLAHGASGTATSMRPHVDGLRRRGIDATAIDLPRGRAERAVPVYAQRLAEVGGPAVIGGHSYGGRVASMLAAADERGRCRAGAAQLPAPPSRPPRRPAHRALARHPCPVLLPHGDADPFARVDLLRAAIAAMPERELVDVPRARPRPRRRARRRARPGRRLRAAGQPVDDGTGFIASTVDGRRRPA